MSGWPPIADGLLHERLTLDDAAFWGFFATTFGALPRREFDCAALATALGYPWERPAGSYRLRGRHVEPLDAMAPKLRAALLAGRDRGRDGARRYPLLAIGSNGAPATLTRKLQALGGVERELLVLTGSCTTSTSARPRT